jgi:hypothetical protein
MRVFQVLKLRAYPQAQVQIWLGEETNFDPIPTRVAAAEQHRVGVWSAGIGLSTHLVSDYPVRD